MSYDHTFDDYIRGLTLVKSNKYFPSTSAGKLIVRRPPSPYECEYSFEAEHAARRAHEAYVKAREEATKTPPPPPPHRNSPVERAAILPSTSHHPVLQPSRGAPVRDTLPSVSSSSSLASSSAAGSGSGTAPLPQTSFEDFEATQTIFDDLHMKTIDDKSALSEIWGAVQVLPNSTVSFNVAAARQTSTVIPSTTTQLPQNTAAPPTTTTSSIPPVALPRTMPSTYSQYAMPPPLSTGIVPQRPLAPKPAMPSATSNGRVTPSNGHSTPTLNDSRAALAAKLTAKGFRSHVVQLCLVSLPHDRLAYVEYYIKATSNLEKKSVPADKGLSFLLDCQLTDKQDILRYADTVVQLAGMGFSTEKCMSATREAKGDRVKALDVCLAAS